jgi:hypothetical protein
MAKRRSTRCDSMLLGAAYRLGGNSCSFGGVDGTRVLSDKHVCIRYITAGYGTTATTLHTVRISVSSSFCLYRLRSTSLASDWQINGDANPFIVSSTHTFVKYFVYVRMETIAVPHHCRERKSGVYHLLPRAIRNKVFGVSVLVTACFKTPVHKLRHARNTPGNTLSFFGLSPMWLDAHYNQPITYGMLDTEPYWQAARSSRSARTADTISDRVLCFAFI